jgi:hypothetical protein
MNDPLIELGWRSILNPKYIELCKDSYTKYGPGINVFHFKEVGNPQCKYTYYEKDKTSGWDLLCKNEIKIKRYNAETMYIICLKILKQPEHHIRIYTFSGVRVDAL